MGHLFLTEERIKEVLDAARETPRDFALLHIAVSTALRASDILGLRRNDVIDSDGEIVRVLRLRMKKTGRWIERPLREDTRNAIRDWLASREDKNPWLFCSLGEQNVRKKKPLHRMSYHRIIRKYLSQFYHRSVLQGCSTHTLRRSVAKIVYKKTGKIAVAQAVLGHTSPVNTMRYLDPQEIQETANNAVLSLEI